jgi:hypothetical protein
MSKHLKVTLTLFVVCVCGVGVLWAGAKRLTPGQEQSLVENRIDPYADINEKAGRVGSGDEAAIRELADAVFRGLPVGEVPDLIARPYRERVIRSEINFRNGRRQGVAEANIVRLIDELAARFAAPDYARTSPEEVRDLRLSLSHTMPRLIPQRPLQSGNAAEESVGFSVAPSMSPLEAIYVTAFLIWQKQHSPYSLFTQAERAEIEASLQRLQTDGFELTQEERANVRMALIEQRIYPNRPQLMPEDIAERVKQHSREQGGSRIEGRARLIVRPSTPRQEEMQAVVRRANSLNIRDALDLAHRSLDTLDIER